MAVGSRDSGFFLVAIHRNEGVFYLPAWEMPCKAEREAAALGKGRWETIEDTYPDTGVWDLKEARVDC